MEPLPDASAVSPSATYPVESPLSWMDRSEPLGGIAVEAITEPNRQELKLKLFDWYCSIFGL
ncbi:hypothetical protein INR49_031322 [Caranx melampygus]|nr:hypothetical protein INR49_031322 [Caranx melampygus]